MRAFYIEGEPLQALHITEVSCTPREERLQRSILQDGVNSVLLTLGSVKITVYLSPHRARHAILFCDGPELNGASSRIAKAALRNGDK